MTHIELPRAVEVYFAFAELPATGRGRQFTITFTYMEGGRLDRLQWWWQVSKAQERAGDALVQSLRQEAINRFRQHIERWLTNSSLCLRGGDPFPRLESLASSPARVVEPETSAAVQPEVEDSPELVDADRLREYARMAVGR
jgi:CHAD domain-containing protein